MHFTEPTDRQVIANRANARHSTGPRTEEGKARASRNRTTYGFTGGSFFLLPQESHEEYDTLLESLRDEYAPATETEELLVMKLAQHHTMQQRALYYQTMALLNDDEEAQMHLINLGMRYHTQHERAFNKVLTQLKDTQGERRAALLGVEENKAALLDARRRKAEADTQIAAAKLQVAVVKAAAATASPSNSSPLNGFESQNAYPIPPAPAPKHPDTRPNAA